VLLRILSWIGGKISAQKTAFSGPSPALFDVIKLKNSRPFLARFFAQKLPSCPPVLYLGNYLSTGASLHVKAEAGAAAENSCMSQAPELPKP